MVTFRLTPDARSGDGNVIIDDLVRSPGSWLSMRRSTGIVIRANTTGYPTHPEDGFLVLDRAAPAGMSDSYDHEGLTNGLLYYYRAFAYYEEGGRYYAGGVPAEATPAGPGDFDRDGDVDQEDFGFIQTCLDAPFVVPGNPDCNQADFDGDTDVDQEDLTTFQDCMSGANVHADPGCAVVRFQFSHLISTEKDRAGRYNGQRRLRYTTEVSGRNELLAIQPLKSQCCLTEYQGSDPSL